MFLTPYVLNVCFVKKVCILPERVVTRGLCGILKTVPFLCAAGSAWPLCGFMSQPVSRASRTTAREAPCENTDPGASWTLLIQADPLGGQLLYCPLSLGV